VPAFTEPFEWSLLAPQAAPPQPGGPWHHLAMALSAALPPSHVFFDSHAGLALPINC
jgi:hypothetical protein